MENVQKQKCFLYLLCEVKEFKKTMGGSSSGIKELQAFKRCSKTCYLNIF